MTRDPDPGTLSSVPPAVHRLTALLVGASMADKPTTLTVLFVSQALSWAGVPALGAAAMAAAGGLASQGVVSLWAVLVVGTIGAAMGGIAGWWIGNRLTPTGGDRSERFDATRRGRALGAGERFASRWGPLVVFLVPSWVSGALGMPLRRFVVWNLLAAAAWNVGAGTTVYGVGFALSGGSGASSATAIVVGLAALLVVGSLFVRRKRSTS
jgi:membrane protein DedA with SNARE-associated domain